MSGSSTFPPSRDGVAALDAPLLVVVGSEDEAFRADEFAPLVAAHTQVPRRVEVVGGANHNGVHHDPRAIALTAEWLSGQSFSKPAAVAAGS